MTLESLQELPGNQNVIEIIFNLLTVTNLLTTETGEYTRGEKTISLNKWQLLPVKQCYNYPLFLQNTPLRPIFLYQSCIGGRQFA